MFGVAWGRVSSPLSRRYCSISVLILAVEYQLIAHCRADVYHPRSGRSCPHLPGAKGAVLINRNVSGEAHGLRIPRIFMRFWPVQFCMGWVIRVSRFYP
jgi:hypothetical protein